jgi:alpha-galactosidase
MIKVVFIGAGGAGWTLGLSRDILTVPELRDTVFCLTDIDPERLEITRCALQKDIDRHSLSARVTATTDRREALKDADYIINAVRVGGIEMCKYDVEIPLKDGVDQCIGDTLGPGGIMYAQRGIPVVLDFCKDIREVAKPGAWFLNYVNPMSAITWAVKKYARVNVLGLCHGVQHTAEMLARVLKVEPDEFDYLAAGVNHMTWFLKLMRKGNDITPSLPKAFEKCDDKELLDTEKARIDLLLRTGYFATESNGFTTELLPWYRKNRQSISDWISLREGHHAGETLGGLRFNMELQEFYKHCERNAYQAPELPLDQKSRSYEHASYIIEAMETGRIYKGCFNTVNHGAISNLPDDAIVETPCSVDQAGVHVARVGNLPLPCAAICNSMISVHRMAMEAAVTGDATLLKQAMMMDPLTGAVCSTPEIWQMTDELLVAQAEYLPQFADAIRQAKINLKTMPKRKDVDLWPPTRKKPRTYAEMQAQPEEQIVQVIKKIILGSETRSQ